MHQPCEHRSRSDDSCLYSCFGGGRCEGTVSQSHYKTQCDECEGVAREKRRVRTQATQAAQNYGWGTTGNRDSYEPTLLHALAGLPGGDLYSPHSHRRPQQQRSNNHNLPEQQVNGRARPIRNLPPMPSSQPQYYSQRQMRAEPRRAPKPDPIRIQNTKVHQPQIHHAVYQPHAAQVAQVVYAPKRPVRRDSNGVSEFGSDDGDSPGWRSAHMAAPRAVSPLQQGYNSYQPWPR
ncbi:hypothetical protein SCAR479_09848 [Seiridium cardinale]|uniref:Uncharacterized protein n=1 Tax=Seiridium cardinale TaxID=138064 RepID=A0ABR2XIQ5_9PEZI